MRRVIIGACILLVAVSLKGAAADDYKRIEDVIYHRKAGTALTMDIFKPAKTNGLGIAFMVSGGWFSAHEAIMPAFYKPFLDHGYTVFAVVHGSQPKFNIPEIEQDIHRAIRFIRHNAGKYGVDPDRLGISGASAGGHLSLTMAVKGTNGNAQAKDPVDRESSEVQCVACFFPPTDFLNYSKPEEEALGIGVLKQFKPAFGPRAENDEDRLKVEKEASPIYFVHSNIPPILIIHGDADKLVPIYQAERFMKRCEEVGAVTKLAVRPGKQHGWPNMAEDMEVCADWFDQHLKKESSKFQTPSSREASNSKRQN
jgi:acetyl esterase/lipase